MPHAVVKGLVCKMWFGKYIDIGKISTYCLETYYLAVQLKLFGCPTLRMALKYLYSKVLLLVSWHHTLPLFK